MRKLFLLILTITVVFFISGCGADSEPTLSITEGGGKAVGLDSGGESSGYMDDSGFLIGDNGNAGYITPGQMTASEWSDVSNYDFYLSLFEGNQTTNEGIFTPYYLNWYFDTMNMVTVTVTDGSVNHFGAVVKLLDGQNNVLYTSVTNAFGKAYLFPKTDILADIAKVEVTHGDSTVANDYVYTKENNTVSISVIGTNPHSNIVELMFVIDTTGSMGDEIEFLKSEIEYVVAQIYESNPTTEIRLALLFYRDSNDTYLTKYYDFSTDIDEQNNKLSQQSANGGGDFPEAVATALDEAINKSWSSENTTKLLFHVLDAPPHYTEQSMSKYTNSVLTASEKGIRIIPIASSGIDKHTEYLLRNEAMMTGGTYIYITDDSGIGGSHIQASVGENIVEFLNECIIRVIKEYHTGIPSTKTPYDQAN